MATVQVKAVIVQVREIVLLKCQPVASGITILRIVAMLRTEIEGRMINLDKAIADRAIGPALELAIDRRLCQRAAIVPVAAAQVQDRRLVRQVGPLIDQAVVLAQGLRRDRQVAVAAEIESAITAHREAVTAPAAADLVEAAEIMRAPAVLAAVAAWAAADSVVGVEAVEGSEAADVAAEGAVVAEDAAAEGVGARK